MKKETKNKNFLLLGEAITDISDRTFIVLGIICAICLLITTTLLIVCTIKINEMQQLIFELEQLIQPYMIQ